MAVTVDGNYVVCHAVPGRLRVKVAAIRARPAQAVALERWLAQRLPAVRVSAQPITGSVVLVFDRRRADPTELLDVLTAGLSSGAYAAEPSGAPTPSGDLGSGHRLVTGGASRPGRLWEVAALAGYLAYGLVRQIIFRSPVAQGPLSLMAGVAIVGALPLLRDAVRDVRRGRIAGLYPFLAVAFGLAIALGEALTALEVVVILRAGMLLEERVADHSRRAIRQILPMAARPAYVRLDGVEVETPADRLRVGDVIVLGGAERLPVDGEVVVGQALIDESYITGRSEPTLRQPGDRVFAGTLVRQGRIEVRAAKVGEETYLARLVQMVESSLAKRAPVEQRADVLAARLMRLGLASTVATLVLTGSGARAFTVLLVMSCPCATVLAASTAIAAAVANAARNRILAKGGAYLERVSEADCFCFDKTGTVTLEESRVVEVVSRGEPIGVDQVLGLAAAVEYHNQHPLARAVVAAASSRGCVVPAGAAAEVVLGRGVRARLGESTVLVGSRQFLADEGVHLLSLERRAEGLAAAGYTVLCVARDAQPIGLVAIASEVDPSVKEVLDSLRRDGVASLHLVSGDVVSLTRSVAAGLGFDGYGAPLLPEEKAEYVSNLRAAGRRVIVVGDGLNDTLAFARAEAGVAIGAGGTQAAVEAADIAVVDHDLTRLVLLRRLGRETLRVVEQNHWLAVTTNVVGLLLGAAGVIGPAFGGALHLVHTLGIVANSSRLTAWQPETAADAHSTGRSYGINRAS